MNRNTVRLYFLKLRERIAAEMDARYDALPEDLRSRFRRFERDVGYDKAAVGVNSAAPIFGIIGHGQNVFTVEVPSEIPGTTSDQPRSRRQGYPPVFVGDMIVVRSLKGPSVRVTLQRSKEAARKKFYLFSAAAQRSKEAEWKHLNLFSAAADLLIRCARTRLQYCRGLSSDQFHLFLKECEFFVFEKSGHERVLAQWMGLENLPAAAPLNQHVLDKVQGKIRSARLRERGPKALRERTTAPTAA